MANGLRVERWRNAGRAIPRALRRPWVVLVTAGAVLIVAGALLIAGPLLGVWSRGSADQTALQAWNNGGSAALAGPVHGSSADVAKTPCGSSAPGDYALVTFTALSAYGYAGVAGNGTWDMLNQRSMVHYQGTPNPGQQGNAIFAFHREPNFEHIDQLSVGGTVTVQDRACHSYVYRVTGRWVLAPQQVSQLAPTSGWDLTLITCDPWWQDYNRLVWRATLVSAPASSGATAPAAAAPSNPSF
ncbi:MAG: class E sortase [Candidatus Dormibacteraeota bacterium]|nr:class E sortase [Candidatus Dormibacteraeota bacterium]MBV9525892.1 class E sortase [Candidatus Dormibacteraeota bacterium]